MAKVAECPSLGTCGFGKILDMNDLLVFSVVPHYWKKTGKLCSLPVIQTSVQAEKYRFSADRFWFWIPITMTMDAEFVSA